MTYSMEKLLDLVIAENASDLHLVVDKEPIVRLHGQLLSAGKAKLTSEDTLRMFKEIAPEKKHNDLEEHGGSEFSYAYGDKARFRVSAYLDRGKPAVAIPSHSHEDSIPR
ncbi:MAG: hypothetical protein U5N86_13840 [Planctomycetota bacterium]|nr:hypothetical protein [Planctomycetota bacterium]